MYVDIDNKNVNNGCLIKQFDYLNPFALEMFKELYDNYQSELCQLVKVDEKRLKISLGENGDYISGLFVEEENSKELKQGSFNPNVSFSFNNKVWYMVTDWYKATAKEISGNRCFGALYTLLKNHFPMYSASQEYLGEINDIPQFKYYFYKTDDNSNCETSSSIVKEDELIEQNNAFLDFTISAQQIIFYGAPGTGKSHTIKKMEIDTNNPLTCIRTTFHPDSDYATFVGCYKPHQIKDGERKGEITYNFVEQAFLEAYKLAWQNPKKKYALIIEEINRGNCAQIFGDIFQLLDREKSGWSTYPIKANTDIVDYLEGIGISNYSETMQKLYGEEKSGYNYLSLPPNLSILATMNTSDQFLFPIDSAFKRRWDWKYEPIKQPKAGVDGEPRKWRIKAKDLYCYWWEFLVAINKEIEKATDSEDKQLGYFFVKPKDGIDIDAETFVSKVIFYLWNDVFKDEDSDIFKYKKLDGKWDVTVKGFDDTNKDIYFRNFFTSESIDDELVCWFINHLLKKHESPMLDGINQNPITKESQDSLPPIAYMRNENEIEGQSDGDKKPEKPHAAENDLEQPATES